MASYWEQLCYQQSCPDPWRGLWPSGCWPIRAGGGAPWALGGSARCALPVCCRFFVHLRAGEECSLRAQKFNYRLSCSCRTIIPYAPSIFPTSDPTFFSPTSKWK